MTFERFDKLSPEERKLALEDLANIPPSDPQRAERAEDFVRRFGNLRGRKSGVAVVLLVADLFRQVWDNSSNSGLLQLFMEQTFRPLPGDPLYGDGPISAVAMDAMRKGKFVFTARDLMDVLAMQLLNSRKSLHRCERSECRKYFIKEPGGHRAKYCSLICSGIERTARNTEWQRAHRAEGKSKGDRHAKRSHRKN